MFNKKYKKEIVRLTYQVGELQSKKADLEESLQYVNHKYQDLYFEHKALEEALAAQGKVLLAFAGYIANHDVPKNVKKIKIKKGAKNGKKSKRTHV